VFLDERSIPAGARWDQAIPAAQRASRATVILISSHAGAAWYLGDEVVTAITLHREAPDRHLIVPVRLEPGVPLPYGLSHVQALDAAVLGSLGGVAAALREVVARLRGQAAAPVGDVTPGAAPAPPLVPQGDGCDHRRLHDQRAPWTR